MALTRSKNPDCPSVNGFDLAFYGQLRPSPATSPMAFPFSFPSPGFPGLLQMKGWNLMVTPGVLHQWCPGHGFPLSPKICWRVGGVPKPPGRRQQICLSVLIRMSWFGLSGASSGAGEGWNVENQGCEAVGVQCQGCV